MKPPRAKGSGAEAYTEGPFLKQENSDSKAEKAPGERGDPSPSPAPAKRERVSCYQAAALTQHGGDECDSGQTPSHIRAAPGKRGPIGPGNRVQHDSWHRQGVWGRLTGRAQSPSWQLD